MGLCVLAFLLCCWPTCHVGDNLQVGATRGAEKLESKSSYVELKPNKFKKRTDLKTGRYRTERTRQES
jgi:hypothetical protein